MHLQGGILKLTAFTFPRHVFRFLAFAASQNFISMSGKWKFLISEIKKWVFLLGTKRHVSKAKSRREFRNRSLARERRDRDPLVIRRNVCFGFFGTGTAKKIFLLDSFCGKHNIYFWNSVRWGFFFSFAHFHRAVLVRLLFFTLCFPSCKRRSKCVWCFGKVVVCWEISDNTSRLNFHFLFSRKKKN